MVRASLTMTSATRFSAWAGAANARKIATPLAIGFSLESKLVIEFPRTNDRYSEPIVLGLCKTSHAIVGMPLPTVQWLAGWSQIGRQTTVWPLFVRKH